MFVFGSFGLEPEKVRHKWNILAKPRGLGGRGLKNMFTFGHALALKRLWHCLHDKGLSSFFTRVKYLKNISITWTGVEKNLNRPQFHLTFGKTYWILS